ncbi:MAG: hypothetical protein AB7Q23_13145 [Hyphomonadaceae bacterium]
MRFALIALALALAACNQQPAAGSATTVPEDARAGSSGVGRVADEPFTLESEALVGLWSFARDCGLYDLVFDADGLVQYYDYTTTPDTAISHRGSWATAADNRVVLTVRLIDMENEPTGEARTFHLDVTSPVTDDLLAVFGAAGGSTREITARRCADEDRE